MLNRRNFIKSAAAAGGLMVLPSWAAARKVGPCSKLNVALVGVGGIGAFAVGSLINYKYANIVALCDVDDARGKAVQPLPRLAAQVPRLPRYARPDGQAD